MIQPDFFWISSLLMTHCVKVGDYDQSILLPAIVAVIVYWPTTNLESDINVTELKKYIKL